MREVKLKFNRTDRPHSHIDNAVNKPNLNQKEYGLREAIDFPLFLL